MIKRITLKYGNLATENNFVSLYDVNKDIFLDEIVRVFDLKTIEDHFDFVKGTVEVVNEEDFRTK